MALNIAIKSGWQTTTAGNQLLLKLCATGGFFYFQDGSLECVLMSAPSISMGIVNRKKKESFEDTVKAAIASNPRLRLVTNGSYFLFPNNANSSAWKLASKAWTYATPGAEDPSFTTIYGKAYDKLAGLSILGLTFSDPGAACLYFEAGGNPRWTFDIGDPPSSCTAGISGLIPLIIKKQKIDDTNQRYKAAKAYGGIGRLSLARSSDSNLLLAMLQPDKRSGLSIDQIRDKLFDADMSDAVLLDGADSVMMVVDGVWKVHQSDYKKATTNIGLGFFYEPKMEPHTVDVDLM